MKTQVDLKLENLRSDFARLCGKPFSHFYCPILHRDEETRLCKAHIISRAFPSSPRSWTVQRSDVDAFYGSNFEADFVSLQYKENVSLDEVMADRKLSRLIAPEIMVDDVPVEYFVTEGRVPDQYTPVELDVAGNRIRLGLKVPPEKFMDLTKGNWELVASKDVRISALVSLIKAAHLSLFEIIGYQYALSAGGHFVGRQILGEFFGQNREKSRRLVLENSHQFFREFAHMVRPVHSLAAGIQGTISDRKMLICRDGTSLAWSLVVFIPIMQSMNAVLIPIFDEADAVQKYLEFLNGPSEELVVSQCIFLGDRWEIDERTTILKWPKTGVLYPEEKP